MKEIVYLFKVREEAPDLDKDYLQEYEALCSTIHWKFLQAENLDFGVENVDVVFTDDFIKNYYIKHFKYDTTKICAVIVAFMKADVLDMGVNDNGK